MQQTKTIQSEEARFAFGRNWSNFLILMNEDRLANAVETLKNMLGRDSLQGVHFLDIGSGSGLFSLAARRLGATVTSFDYDLDSVACTRKLKEEFDPDAGANWRIEQGSVLDQAYMESLGTFDIVYSWGVLHHTGNMWQAFRNATDRMAPNSQLFISIYNDEGWRSALNLKMKKTYVGLPKFLKPVAAFLYVAWQFLKGLAADIIRFRNPVRRYNNAGYRGMSFWYDMVDWLGGYPFEVASPEAIFDFFSAYNFRLTKIRTIARGHGCNEFVFRKGQ